MKTQHTIRAAALVLATSLGGSAAAAADAVPQYIKDTVAYPNRGQWQFLRDAARKPDQVLTFAELKSGMAVAELVPGDGYYTRLISHLVGKKGRVYAIVPNGGARGTAWRMQQREGQLPAVVPMDEGQECELGCYPSGRKGYMLPIDYMLGISNITEFANVTPLWEDLSMFGGEISTPEQVDAVFSVDGYHELHYKVPPVRPAIQNGPADNARPTDMKGVTASIFRTMKPGGSYVVADYAAAAGAGFDQADALHRTDEMAVKAEILGAGFVLDAESKLLSNPDDDRAMPAIGMNASRDAMDQYLLRFKKPANALRTDKRPSEAQSEAIMKNYYGNTFFGKMDAMETGKDKNGGQLRTNIYHPDYTYQEFGPLGMSNAPMQAGIWYWDAEGHNCMLHQFPIDQRSVVVCHDYVLARPIGKPMDHNPGGGGGPSIILPGYIMKNVMPK